MTDRKFKFQTEQNLVTCLSNRSDKAQNPTVPSLTALIDFMNHLMSIQLLLLLLELFHRLLEHLASEETAEMKGTSLGTLPPFQTKFLQALLKNMTKDKVQTTTIWEHHFLLIERRILLQD